MPLYEYRCADCHRLFEHYHSVGEPAPGCPSCGGQARKVYSSVGLIFKGSGFHTTDYRRSSGSGNGDSGPASKDGGRESAAAPAESAATSSPPKT